MANFVNSRFAFRRLALLGATVLAGHALPAMAQDAAQAPAPAAPAADVVPPAQADEIVVTGYRRSLQESINAKRESVGFTDSIFAEDIGKFPDTNIAESFNRIPGITITRGISGEGVNVAIRGLGTNFTKILLNNAPVAIASTGRTDSQNTNREVDLDMFPTELFTQLTVSKSPTADMIEGGAAGTVNMRSARPFDKEGMRFTYGAQGTKNGNADGWGYRVYGLASATFGNFGVLVGGTAVRNKVNTLGYETIGLTNPNLTAAQCGAATGCNATGGGNFTIPATVPSNAGNGLTPGATIDRDFLLAHNPGATIQQIDNGLLPRLGRPSAEYGTKDRYNAIASLEWRPSDALHFYVDGMWGKKKNDLQRTDMNWVGRNGAVIPLNTEYDKDDCSQGCVVTKGTYANAQYFLEYRPYFENTTFWGVNPGVEGQITDTLKFDLQGNYTKSKFHRESPSVVVSTAPNSGVTVDFVNDGGVPSITSNIDLNDPGNFIWDPSSSRVNIQDERRETKTKGVRGNLTWGDSRLNVKVGAAYDDVSRSITAYDNSQAWQNAVCGNQPNVFVGSPNTQPPCAGANAPGQILTGYPSYPGYGTGFTAGQTGPVNYLGSLIPTSQLANYLMPGPNGYVVVDWNKFTQASNYDQFHDNAPLSSSANTGASGGYIREKTTGAYGEVNGNVDVAGQPLRFNVGIRYVHTEQTIGGYVSLPDPRNTPATGPAPADGGRYPNVVNFVTTDNSYDNWLPSANVAYNVSDHALVRAAVSKTMTRPDPSAMLPGVNFSSPSADTGTIGNSALKPFTSKNIDLGFEYYTGGAGLVGVAAFRKAVKGFTSNGLTTLPFTDLAQYGITYDSLTPTQQAAINARGGPNAATVTIQQQVNASGTLTVNGLEFNWVQPLDFLLERYLGVRGFGFNANATIIDQKGSGAAPAIALGVAKYAYNIVGYYENHGVTLRLTTTFNKGSQVANANQNGIPLAALYSDNYRQTDFSSIFDTGKIFGLNNGPQLTFDVVNLFKAKQRTYFQFPNATFTEYKPGRTIMVGVRGTF